MPQQSPLSLDLTNLSEHLKLNPPVEIAVLLDGVLFDLVASAELMQSYEGLHKKYVDVMMLRDEFAMMDENLREIWK